MTEDHSNESDAEPSAASSGDDENENGAGDEKKKHRFSSLLPANREPVVPPDELAQLLHETNFTEREIISFYKYATGDTITRAEFGRLCLENGVTNVNLIERMWTVFDADSSGGITHFELVKGLNPLLRGTREEVAGMFFHLYELDGDGELSEEEIISVYSDMVFISEEERKEGLTSHQKKRIADWVQRHRLRDGRLGKETFVNAIMKMEGDQDSGKTKLLSVRTAYFVFLTAWFEVGTSFALPAMGALSDRIKDRFDITDIGIGTLTSAYYFSAMVGPLVGGLFMDQWGPGWVVIGANIIVSLGAMCQAIANGPNQFGLLLFGRLLLGFGGEITPFTTVEILGRLFPDYFGLMAGVRNLIQSTSGFLAFVLLPIWANAKSDYEGDNEGTTFALWMCFVLAIVSLVACIITKISMKKESAATAASSEQQSDQLTISKTMRAFARATTPKAPVGCEKWKLPVSFYFACIGIKAQYFAPFGFTAFSNKLYADKFGQTKAQASLQTGIISLVAGLLGPPMGSLSDKYGHRSASLVIACLVSAVGFAVLAIATGGSAAVWTASMLFAIQYGFGDTVAYISIRFIVGVSRAGIGYGIYGIIGNLTATIVPIIGGVLLDMANGNELVCWYFFGLMVFGALCWVAVRILEGKRSLLELPAEKIIETNDEDLQIAALSYVVSPQRGAEKQVSDKVE